MLAVPIRCTSTLPERAGAYRDCIVKEIAVSSAEPVSSNTNQPTVSRLTQTANPLTMMATHSRR